MPYYRGPRIPADHCPPGTSMDEDANDTHVDEVAMAMILSIITQGNEGCTPLCIRLAEFVFFGNTNVTTATRSLYNSDVPPSRTGPCTSCGHGTDSIWVILYQRY
jgi:hypothetical protein